MKIIKIKWEWIKILLYIKYILNNSVKRNQVILKEKVFQKKYKIFLFQLKIKIILKKPISKTDIHELFDIESFQLLKIIWIIKLKNIL